MNILVKQATIVDSNSPHNGKTQDILIENGKITSIRKRITAKCKTISGENLYVSPGWFDMHVNLRDPGYEHKEDLHSGCEAAAQGGFTGLACMPGTSPPIDSKAKVEYITGKAKGKLVDVHPIGALSNNMEGKDMTEMYDMHNSGAIAFSDEKNPVKNSALMLRSLIYTRGFNSLIISHSEDEKINLNGKMNEGISSTSLGLKGMPGLAEELMVARDIELAEYAQSKLHLTSVTTAKSIDLIRAAKKKGTQVTAEVAAHLLAYDDSILETFDSNYKVNPPFRTKREIRALKKGLADGTIDAICSDHLPEDVENKVIEFDEAAFGTIGLETTFAVANTFSGLTLPQLISKISQNPREILNLKTPVIKSGEKANITIFDPNIKWKYTEDQIYSKSKNSPFINVELKGKSIGTYNNNKYRAS